MPAIRHCAASFPLWRSITREDLADDGYGGTGHIAIGMVIKHVHGCLFRAPDDKAIIKELAALRSTLKAERAAEIQ